MQLVPAPDSALLISERGRKLRPVAPRETFALRQWEMDFRFVREVEYLEREGRVPSRPELERTIGLERGGLSAVRLGLRGIGLVQTAILQERYRGDRDFIMFNQRNKELASPYVSGIGRIDKYEPYIHRYTSAARWRVGSRPETEAAYYPADPQNEHWTPPRRKNIHTGKAAPDAA